MQRYVFKLYVVGLLLVAGFYSLQGQSSALDLQIPVVDRLPKWYYEQAEGQAVGISLGASQKGMEADYEQALCFALIRAALQQSDTNVVRGNMTSVSSISSNMRNEALRISATLKIPVHYIVLDQCHLKNGPVLVLLQYQYRSLAATESLEFVVNSKIQNDTVSYEEVTIKNEKHVLHYEFGDVENGIIWSAYWATQSHEIEQTALLDIHHFCTVMHNEYLLQNPERYGYIGFMHFDALRQDLYRKLMYRQYKDE